MTLEEKVMQLVSIESASLFEDRVPSAEKMASLLKRGIGQITRLSGSNLRLEPLEARAAAEQIQTFLTKETRLGIPAIIHEECLSGLMALRATIFPQSIGLASSWDRDLIRRISRETARQLRAVGACQGLAPVGDVAIDPRWGRVEETFGEDPYLVAVLCSDFVRGLQGENLGEAIMATMKSMGAHGFPEGGRNKAPAHVGPRELSEHFLFPFEVGVRLAGCMSVMTAYNEIDGIPCTESHYLLRTKLKEEWRFEGVVVSDYDAIHRLYSVHHTAKDDRDAAIRALNAGVDMELDRPVCYPELVDAVSRGDIAAELIDASVSRVLLAKSALGLFDEPLHGPVAELDTDDARGLALNAARESMVLLKNDGLLPLRPDVSTIAVLGPCSDNPLSLLGDYAYPVHLKLNEPGVRVTTVLAGLKGIASKGTSLSHASGTGFLEKRDDFERAIEIASKSKAAIVVVGENSSEGGGGLSGEGSDSSTLRLPDVQMELVKRASEVNRNVVAVIVSGRPLNIMEIVNRCPAVIAAWYPGEESGTALAEVIFGKVNPSGKLPISFPKDCGQIPAHYWRKPTSFGTYSGQDANPLFSFGHGLSYTTFEYSNLVIAPGDVRPDSTVTASFRITNTGRVAGSEVPQLYVSKSYSAVTRPIKQLKGFTKFELKPQESRRIEFRIPTSILAFYDPSMELIVESGDYLIEIGPSSSETRLSGKFRISESLAVPTRHPYFTSVSP